MAQQMKSEDIAVVEAKANELVSMTFALCEQKMSEGPRRTTPPQKVLAAAALSVQASIKTFLAATDISEERAS